MAKILIIDDDEQFRSMLSERLAGEGFKTLTAADGREGLKRFQEEEIDLAIVDLIMPEKEGLETIWEIGQEYPDVKIIAVSGGGRFSPGSFLKISERLGAAYSFQKPFKWKEMLQAINDLLVSQP